jgi:starch synthase
VKILMVASEASPFAKTGGLADVMGALPAALAKLGEQVGVVMPRYSSALIPQSERVWYSMPLWVGPHVFLVAIDQVVNRGVRYFFVDCPPLFDRAEIYGDYPDDHLRFAVLSQAAVGIARHIFQTDIFHAHDWHAGLLGVYLRTTFSRDATFMGSRCVFTIHNLGYQGNFPGHLMGDLGLDGSLYHPGGLEFWGQVSFLKAGILWADSITTVSPTYAREIQTPEHGFGMDGVLRSQAARLTGILNGIDYDEWNPATDPHLPARYSILDLAGKQVDKRALLQEMGLPDRAGERPLLGIVSRFTPQKGLDLVLELMDWLAEQGVSVAVIGSGDRALEDAFHAFAAAYPDQVAVRIGYDNGLAHRIEAGSDMFVMPSRYEPCGLNQIYSLRYVTQPIVRATGGLDDTVDPDTGFKFGRASADALREAIGTALEEFQDRENWTQRIRNCMAKDFSWEASARRYQSLYKSL